MAAVPATSSAAINRRRLVAGSATAIVRARTRRFENPEGPGPVGVLDQFSLLEFATRGHLLDRAVDRRRGAGNDDAAGRQRADAIRMEVEVRNRARAKVLAMMLDQV